MGGVEKTPRFGPQQLSRWQSDKVKRFVRPFQVHHYNTLRELCPDGIAPYKKGVTIATICEKLKTSSGALLEIGFSGAGIEIEKLATHVHSGQGMSAVHVDLYNKDLKQGTDAYRKEMFDALIGKFCDPNIVLRDFSIEETMRRENMEIGHKAIVTAEYINFDMKGIKEAATQGKRVGELAKILVTNKTGEIDKHMRWVFVGSVGAILYQGDVKQRNSLINNAVATLHPGDVTSSMDALSWIEDFLRLR